jgi:peptidoglycan/xylan/chitin deacetylase (PgdA/CDA1 family)
MNGLKLAISLVWYAGDLITRAVGRLVGRRPAPAFVVLYYHGVRDEDRAGFARQMDALSRGFTVLRAGFTGALPPGRHYVAVTFDDAFRSVAANGVPELVSRELPSTIFVPVGFMGSAPGWEMEADVAGEVVMSADELSALPDLVELGSHTLRHPHLSRLESTVLREELARSRAELEDVLSKPVTLLAFPYGDYDERAVAACREAGYERVFAIEPRAADPRGDDYVRGRVAAEPTDGPLLFHLKSHGAFAWMPRASRLKRRVLARRAGR